MRAIAFWCLGVLVSWWPVAACQDSSPRHQDTKTTVVLDLMDQWAPAPGETEKGGSFYRRMPVMRRGRSEEALVLVAPVSVQTNLQGLRQGVKLKCLAAPLFNLGDGFQVEFFVLSSRGRIRVYSRYFDPGRDALDRNWTSLEFPLDPPEGETAQLVIEISAGPQGDLVGDWVALAEVRCVREGAQR